MGPTLHTPSTSTDSKKRTRSEESLRLTIGLFNSSKKGEKTSGSDPSGARRKRRVSSKDFVRLSLGRINRTY